MNNENAKLPQRAASVEAIRKVINLMDDTELVFGLKELGVPKDDLSKISERIFKQRQHECDPPAYVPRRLGSSNNTNLLNDTWTDGDYGKRARDLDVSHRCFH
jgi:alcohol dehydrogenase class IV